MTNGRRPAHPVDRTLASAPGLAENVQFCTFSAWRRLVPAGQYAGTRHSCECPLGSYSQHCHPPGLSGLPGLPARTGWLLPGNQVRISPQGDHAGWEHGQAGVVRPPESDVSKGRRPSGCPGVGCAEASRVLQVVLPLGLHEDVPGAVYAGPVLVGADEDTAVFHGAQH